MRRTKNKTTTRSLRLVRLIHSFVIGAITGLVIFSLIIFSAVSVFDKTYRGHVYPTVSVGSVAFGGKTPQEVEAYWLDRNEPFNKVKFEFTFGSDIATVSGIDLGLGYDATLSGVQAYSVGRSGHFLSDLFVKFLKNNTDLSPYFRWDSQTLDDILSNLAAGVDVPAQDALFQFKDGRVVQFKPSKSGRKLNIVEVKKQFTETLVSIPNNLNDYVTIPLVVDTVSPSVTIDRANSFGIRELIGRGYSEFAGSIPGRIHNIVLASSRINGILIKPGEVFSFNQALGDVSATTGFQPAYIIKSGRTVLGDGGGVCQVSTTLFRAALNAGLPIVERRAHAYRVHYYEEAGYKAGLDATVFAPSVDLKIKNDTASYILIQAKPDTKNMSLTFELYGAGDGRKAEILNHKVWGITAPPPPLYQDDPTLPPGTTKQVDFAAWGAQASFQYKVTRGNEILQDTTFFSRFQPWQAVYLKGPQQ